MNLLIAILAGDGIGPEVTAEAVRVMNAVAGRFGHTFDLVEGLVGGAAIDETGSPLPAETVELCQRADSVLLGAVGGPRWPGSGKVRPEQGLLDLRRLLGAYANLRPVRVLEPLLHASALRPEIARGTDMLFVRELTGGMYFGPKVREGTVARDLCEYSVAEVERVSRVAGRLAASRRRRVVSVDKANVLETSRLWREVVSRVFREEFPSVELQHHLVDSTAFRLVVRPADFDVILTENLFGDILTDEAAALVGSIGMLPSASLGDGPRGLYEPVHGSAPDIAGTGKANPYGAILSVAMMLRHSFGLAAEAAAVERAAEGAIAEGYLSADVARPGVRARTTSDIGAHIAEQVRAGKGAEKLVAK